MAHLWIADMRASRLVQRAKPEAIEESLELLLDDRDVFSDVARCLGLREDVPDGELGLSRWLGSLELPPSSEVRSAVMGHVGLPAAAYERFQRSPCELPAEYMEQGARYWAPNLESRRCTA